ncbi:MAG: Gx transporter family protein [Clostridia bacterium]|nr:Gx transporter family protein [Clostridia bacterium]
MNLKYKKQTILALSVSLAMILSFVESLIPPLVAIPGVKIGLANIVTVFLLYTLGIRAAGTVSLIRVLLSALLFGNVQCLIFALSGALLSFGVMIIAKYLLPFGTVGVSVLGAVAHNAGQVVAAVIVMETAALAYYFIPLVVSGTIAGVFVGLIAATITIRLNKILKMKK